MVPAVPGRATHATRRLSAAPDSSRGLYHSCRLPRAAACERPGAVTTTTTRTTMQGGQSADAMARSRYEIPPDALPARRRHPLLRRPAAGPLRRIWPSITVNQPPGHPAPSRRSARLRAACGPEDSSRSVTAAPGWRAIGLRPYAVWATCPIAVRTGGPPCRQGSCRGVPALARRNPHTLDGRLPGAATIWR
jgi:hypothetical protein